jgi:hypothetical protein
MRGWRWCAALATVALLALQCADAQATATASGDQHGIALAQAVGVAFAGVPAESYVQSGFAYMLSPRSREPGFRWAWGSGPVAGMVPAREQATVGLHKGRVTWWRDDLTPLPCGEPLLCGAIVTGTQARTELVVDRSGVYYAYGDSFRHTCFGRLGGSTPLNVGDRIWSVIGEFQAPLPHGGLQLLKSTYPWGLTGGGAAEAASLSQRTHLPVREQTTISASPTGAPGFTFSTTFGYPKQALAPHVELCH